MKLFGRKKHASRSDEQLMQLVGRGETSAFDELYERYAGRLLRYFLRMIGGDEARAQDMLHDLFLKIVERPELYGQGRGFSTWIFSSAHNMCKNEYRNRERRRPVAMEFDELPAQTEHPLEMIDRSSFLLTLMTALDTFEEEHRTTFLLRYQEGFSVREIGDVLGCPEGTVKSRLFYTTRRLAVRLRDFDPGFDPGSDEETSIRIQGSQA